MNRSESTLAPETPESLAFEDVLYEKKDWVATVTINRPEAHNAYTTATLVELRDAFRDAALDDGIAVVVLTGAGDRAFCTGGDVKEYAARYTQRPRDYWKYMGLFAGCVEALRDVGKPTIARLNGIVAGGGNELNLACDLAVAADDITIRQVGTRVGSVAAGGATQWLPITIGDRRAREMLLTCDPVTRAAGARLGSRQPRRAAGGARRGGRRAVREADRQVPGVHALHAAAGRTSGRTSRGT